MLQPENRSQKYSQLFDGIDEGTIKIPKFQREFVWSKEQTAKLIDSIMKGFPVGTFTYWETTDELRHAKDVGNVQLPSTPKGQLARYILDGQQRITSLYAVRKGAIFRKDDGHEIHYKDISIDLDSDPDTDDEVVSAIMDRSKGSISVYDLLNLSIENLVEGYKNYIGRISTYKERLENYDFSTIIIGNAYPIDIATEVFTRINTGGTELQLFEIMVAKTYSEDRNFDLSKEYDELIHSENGSSKDLAAASYETIPPATVLQCVSICLGPEVRRRDILRLDREEFIESWDSVKEAIFLAVGFLRKSLRIPASKLLPYNAILVPLTYFFFKREKPSKRQSELLSEYFWWTSLSQRFSSAVESSLAADRRRMDSVLDQKSPDYRGEEVKLKAKDLAEQTFSTGNAVCKAILCLYAYFRPKSFDTGDSVIVDNSWLSRIDSKNYHHFFPRAYLKRKKYEEWYANSIVNITIVDDHLNKRQIRAQAPSKYMRKFARCNKDLEGTMKTHLIGDLGEFGVWEDNYDEFVSRRAQLVVGELNRRLPGGR